MQEPPRGWYADVRRFCDRHRAVLIMDEIVTGLRYGLGGACQCWEIVPDIVCMGKSLGNGMAVSAMVGDSEFFNWFRRKDPCFVSSTHFGNAVDLAAADAVLDLWNQDGIKHLATIGQVLIDGLRGVGYHLIGDAPRSLLQFDSPAERAYFIVAMRDRGILMNRPNIPNLAHTLGDVVCTVEAARDVKNEMANVDVEALMASKLPKVLFEGR